MNEDDTAILEYNQHAKKLEAGEFKAELGEIRPQDIDQSV